MKVLHLISSLEVGGAQRVLCDVIAQLPQVEHHVLYINTGPVVQQLQEKGVAVEHIAGFFYRYDPFFFIHLLRAIRRIKPDVVHTMLWAANVFGRLAARILGIPVVSSLHNMVSNESWVRTLGDRISLLCAPKVIAVSDAVAQSLQERDKYVPAVRAEITVIANGIDADAMCIAARASSISRVTLHIADDAWVIGTVGRLVKEKNYGLLLKAFAHCAPQKNNSILVVVGDGPEKTALQELARNLGIAQHVVWVGSAAAIDYYHLFNCFVLASPFEGISMALLEAMSCQVPCVVGSFFGQHAVIQSEKTGFVVQASEQHTLQEVIGFADAVMHLYTNADHARVVGLLGFLLIKEHFSGKRMANQYFELWAKEAYSIREKT